MILQDVQRVTVLVTAVPLVVTDDFAVAAVRGSARSAIGCSKPYMTTIASAPCTTPIWVGRLPVCCSLKWVGLV